MSHLFTPSSLYQNYFQLKLKINWTLSDLKVTNN